MLALCLFVLITPLEISQLSEDTFFFHFNFIFFHFIFFHLLPFCNKTVFGEWDLIVVFFYLKEDKKKGRATYMGQRSIAMNMDYSCCTWEENVERELNNGTGKERLESPSMEIFTV